jgi:hypothetical protein
MSTQEKEKTAAVLAVCFVIAVLMTVFILWLMSR